MTNNKLSVIDNLVVSLDYVLNLEEQGEIERTKKGEPLEFIQGSGQIIPGLEKAIYGMEVGDEKEVVIEPPEGYGEYNPTDLVEVLRDDIPESIDLVEGEPLWIRESQTAEPIKATISEVREEMVVLDFNHPLAGETLYFRVKVAGLRDATQEELSHGHVHSGDHHH
jgi:FKBP-type peptidyl-prolyl cis-trans isomerase SlyD